MKSFRPWAVVAAMALAGCGDGGIQSPDFTPVITVESLEIVPVDPQQGSSIPAGTSLSFRAMATISQTVPPGTRDENGNPISEQQSVENVTSQASWSSSNDTVASVVAGVVHGNVASSSAVTITTSYSGKSDTTQVTVTDATLNAVEYVKPQAATRSVNDTYAVVAGSSVPFEIYGRFSDNVVRKLNTPPFSVSWTSGTTTVANNTSGNHVFTALAAGTALITGQVTNVPAANPDSASATLNVQPLNAFCESEFVSPAATVATEASALCLNCAVEQPAAIIDGNLETYGVMSIPVGLLLQSNISATAYDTTVQRLVVGRPAGFVVSRTSAPLLSAELLSALQVQTVQCGVDGACSIVETFDAESGTLAISLLGMLGDQDQFLLSTADLTQTANGLRVIFDGGLLSALATVNVHTACAIAVPEAAP